MRMKLSLACALLTITAFQAYGAADTLPAVRLFTHNNAGTLRSEIQATLHQQITALVQSSNFVSSPDKYHAFTFAGVQQDYRDVIATGEYLLMIASPALKIDTLGGEVTAAEIIVGLRSPGSKNSVFTIDASGRIVGHAKYSGELYSELKKTITQANR